MKLLNYLGKGIRIVTHRLRTQGLRTTLVWLYARGFPKLTGVLLRSYSAITPAVYVGPQYGRRGKRVLEEWGMTGVVNLRAEFDDAAHGLALQEYCHLPTIDDAAISLDHLRQGVTFIERVVQAGGRVYIHCAGGVGRAPTMAAAYFISQGKTLDEALALIRATRPFINIMPPQMARLKEFETLQTKEHV